ncbi:hypothetical protein C6A37_00430 [Desulfobacteraceae bacterium SEEP-SAG9]|nr:hypothetical protein C6A37_00430 [Desulfobacteraceae bacterium SEEP-SAG9]
MKFLRKIKRFGVPILDHIYDLTLIFKGAKTIHCIGDSHTSVFVYLSKNRILKNTRMNFCIVQGATVSGIPNPGSKTQAGPIFESYLKNVPNKDYILLCLGEVDASYVIWYRSKKYGDHVDSQFKRAVNNYYNLLSKLLTKGHKHIIVCSVALPTVKDGQVVGPITALRNKVSANIRERTNLTIRFNRKLREYCRSHKIIFLDLEKKTLNKSTMLIDDRFLNPDQNDHHLYEPVLANYVVQEFKENGFS